MKKLTAVQLLAILCLAPVLPFSLAQQIDSWPMFHHDASHTGYSDAQGPGTNQTLWIFNTNGWVLSSPVAVNSIVYFTSSDPSYFASSNNNLNALSAKDGTKIWNFSTKGKIYTSPAVANDIIYFGSDDHNIYALNAQTGGLIWNHTTGGQAEGSPNVSNGIVYAGSNDNNLYALNASSGSLIWSFQPGRRRHFMSCCVRWRGVLWFL